MNNRIEQTIRTIVSVIETLNHVEVRGEANLNAQLACIQTLKKLKAQLTEKEEVVQE